VNTSAQDDDRPDGLGDGASGAASNRIDLVLHARSSRPRRDILRLLVESANASSCCGVHDACSCDFTADHLGRYGAIGPVAALYGLNLLALSVLQLAMWSWATRQRHLVAPDLPSSVIRRGRRLGLLSTGGYGVAVVMGLAAPGVSVAIFALMSLLSITRLDHRLVSLRRRDDLDGRDSATLS